MSEIKLENLEKSFDDFVAVEKSDLTIQDNEFFVLLGPSGCGKTTTLRMIAGLELPTSGKILLDNEDVTFLRASQRDIAFVTAVGLTRVMTLSTRIQVLAEDTEPLTHSAWGTQSRVSRSLPCWSAIPRNFGCDSPV